jgi:glutamate carboxypeptidase
MDLAIDWKDTSGASDGNLLQHFGLPTIDNLGVRGGNIHNDQEFVLLDSLVERALLTTGTLLNIIKHRHD